MKRYALLLAAVVSGSGCIVETTCDPQTLSIDWSLVDGGDNAGLACDSLNLSADVSYVRVFVDGFDESGAIDCFFAGVTLDTVSSGVHDVIVEGYDVNDYVITRGFATIDVDSCGDTFRTVEAGEEWINIQPDTCIDSVNGSLWYSLRDTTWSALGYEIWFTDGSSVAWDEWQCGLGIDRPVPWGSYTLDWIDEVDASKVLEHWGRCTDFNFSVPNSLTSTIVVPVGDDAACHL